MDNDAKKTALRGISYGLYVIGTKTEGGINAFTANWVTQTSFAPPLVAIGAKKGTASANEIHNQGVFSVSVLESGQKDLAFAFFKPVSVEGDKLGGYEYATHTTGCPVFTDALSWFECKVVHEYDGGDHVVYLGEVIDAGIHREGKPMTLAETGLFYGG